MSREDRLARLEALLARVKANAALRGERPRSHLSIPPEALPHEEGGAPPLPIFVSALRPPPPADESTLEALSQRALALTTSDALVVDAAPPSPEEERWPESVRPSMSEARSAPEPIVDEPSPSFLERAVRDAAAEELSSPLFRVAAEDLRDHERRPLSEIPPPEASSTPPEITPKLDAAPAPSAAEPLTREPWFVEDEPAPAHPVPVAVERDGRGWLLWAGAAAGATLVVGASLLFRSAPMPASPVAGAATNRPVATDQAPRPGPAPAAESVAKPPATPDLASSSPLASSPPLTSAPSALPAAIPDPPETGGLARDRGLLWVETKTPREVFVQGNAAGASGRWLNVPCGLRNVRTAQPGPPPAGSSFPIWMSDGHSVLVPCRSFTRVTLPTDP
ncbi:MAG: hypothetical protein JNL21_16530 [Myxococcales bacterium]|nr:hypothetical protein [Myxococcales bacterium]